MTVDICFLSAAHPIDDKRVLQKEARSLAEAGWSVAHLAPGSTDRGWSEHGVTLETYARRPGRRARITGLVHLWRLARRQQARAYHCNEPDSWLIALPFRLFGAKVVFDAHEHYPPAARRWLPSPLQRIGATCVAVALRMLARLSDRIVLAKASIADDYRAPDRTIVVTNATRAAGTPEPSQDFTAPRLRLVHTGVFSRPRGSLVAVEMLAQVVEVGHDVELVIVGGFNDDSRSEFLRRADERGVAERIVELGWLDYDEAYAALRGCHVGLILFTKQEANNIKAMPHKMFDYMMAGLAVIGPDFAPEIGTMLREADAAVLVDVDDPSAVAAAVSTLATDRGRAQQMGTNGRRAAVGELSWERQAEHLDTMYRDLLATPRT